MKHLSDFQKRFSETKYLEQSMSNLIFTNMQKRRFDAREALWLAGTLERFVDFFLNEKATQARQGSSSWSFPYLHKTFEGEYNLSKDFCLF